MQTFEVNYDCSVLTDEDTEAEKLVICSYREQMDELKSKYSD